MNEDSIEDLILKDIDQDICKKLEGCRKDRVFYYSYEDGFIVLFPHISGDHVPIFFTESQFKWDGFKDIAMQTLYMMYEKEVVF